MFILDIIVTLPSKKDVYLYELTAFGGCMRQAVPSGLDNPEANCNWAKQKEHTLSPRASLPHAIDHQRQTQLELNSHLVLLRRCLRPGYTAVIYKSHPDRDVNIIVKVFIAKFKFFYKEQKERTMTSH